MSSWGGNRIHFRERKVYSQTNINTNNIITLNELFTPNYTAVICAIALNEERYIDEWIKYNLALGFQHIYIYDNSEKNILKNIESSFVTVIHFPGSQKQFEAYDNFITRYTNKHKWGAFIDCDEFIVLKKHKNIIEFLNEYSLHDGIGLNWLMFGTDNQIKYNDEPVTKRFQSCSKQLDIYVKSIVKLNSVYKYINPHYPLFKNGGFMCNINRKNIYNAINEDLNSDVAYIHHYYTKSEEEFREKIERGRADISTKRSLDELINIHEKNNDIKNTDAWDFYSKHS